MGIKIMFTIDQRNEHLLWARFESQSYNRHNLQKAQAHLADVRRHGNADMVCFWESSVCGWLDRAYKAQNNVDVYRAFVCECGHSVAY
jgi:hypothetical protein